MTRFTVARLRAKARWQTKTLMRKYRTRVWWGLDLWTEAELREGFGK